jgi:hypothetical protein
MDSNSVCFEREEEITSFDPVCVFFREEKNAHEMILLPKKPVFTRTEII